MVPIDHLADEIIKLDKVIASGEISPEDRLVLHGAVSALRWIMYPDLTAQPSKLKWREPPKVLA